MLKPCASSLPLFGGPKEWNAEDWEPSDDRVRGGKSESHLGVECNHAIFNGHLDIETLGGAGFASQRTISEDRCWDLSTYNGIEIIVSSKDTDENTYTFILKDQIPNKGEMQSTISWEYDFKPAAISGSTFGADTRSVYIQWSELKPTYRGREKRDAGPLNLKSVRRMSIMIRSFFGKQHGDFSFRIISIAAVQHANSCVSLTASCSEDEASTKSESLPEKNSQINNRDTGARTTFWSWLFGSLCSKL